MEDQIKRSSEINVKIHLDKNNVPVKMEWAATDAQYKGMQNCKAVLVSIWEPEQRQALRIDLWTKEMRIDEMDLMVYQTLATLSESYQKATNNKKGAEDIKQFAMAFAKNAGIIK